MKKEKILQILKALDEESKLIGSTELGMDQEEFGEIIEIMLEGNLMTGVKIVRGGMGSALLSIVTNRPKITIMGIEYLEQNSK